MTVKEFVLQTLLAMLRVDSNDNAAAEDRTADLVCAGIEKTADKQRAACSYTMGDGTEVTVYVVVDRPHRKKAQ